MTNKKLALMTIPALAAILIGGSFAPIAHAGFGTAECDALFAELIDAINEGNQNKAEGIVNALDAACNPPAECEALFDLFFEAILDGNLKKASGMAKALNANGCGFFI